MDIMKRSIPVNASRLRKENSIHYSKTELWSSADTIYDPPWVRCWSTWKLYGWYWPWEFGTPALVLFGPPDSGRHTSAPNMSATAKKILVVAGVGSGGGTGGAVAYVFPLRLLRVIRVKRRARTRH